MIQSATTLVSRMSGVRLAMASIGATSLAVLAAIAFSSGASAADPLKIQAGRRPRHGRRSGVPAGQGDHRGRRQRHVHDRVRRASLGDASVSGRRTSPPDQWPVSGWAAPAATPPTPVDLGDASYDGTSFMNTGLLWKGSSATATFPIPGTYIFDCVIHPGMSGEIDVVETGAGGATTQAEADAAAAASTDALLSQEDAVRQARLDDVESVKNPDGTTTWNIFADASTVPADLPGGGTGYLELYEMLPTGLEIGVGDTVHWSAIGAHTVTFPASGQDPGDHRPLRATGRHRRLRRHERIQLGSPQRGTGRAHGIHPDLPIGGSVRIRLCAPPVPWPARRHRRRPAAVEWRARDVWRCRIVTRPRSITCRVGWLGLLSQRVPAAPILLP